MSEKKHTSDPVEENPATEQSVEDQARARAENAGSAAADEISEKKEHDAESEAGKLRQVEAELAELRDKYLRLYAEFDNYKKRTIREKLDLMRTGAQDTLTSMLTVLDDFDRAKKIADDPATTEQFTEGVELVYQKLYGTLKNMGLHEMESTGTPFDPEQHEAITEIPAPSEDLKGKVVDTLEKGYFLHDKIIRHAKVVIGK